MSNRRPIPRTRYTRATRETIRASLRPYYVELFDGWSNSAANALHAAARNTVWCAEVGTPRWQLAASVLCSTGFYEMVMKAAAGLPRWEAGLPRWDEQALAREPGLPR